MGYFTNDHFKLLNKWRGQKWDSSNPEQKMVYAELKEAYAITEAWAQQLQKELFPAGPPPRLMKKPINQGGVFERYNWARIYPSADAPKALAYTVGVDADLGFVVKIDTVQADVELRARYEKLRGPLTDASPIVAVLSADQGLAKQSLSELVAWSADSIRKFGLRYDEVAKELGMNTVMDDAAVLARFGTSPEFKQGQERWSQDEASRFCNLARAVHEAGLDWWHTQIAGPHIRFGRKQPGYVRAAGVLGYVHCGKRLMIQVNSLVEGVQGRDWQDLTSDVVQALADELIDARDDVEEWKPVSVERPGFWPDQLQSEPGDPGNAPPDVAPPSSSMRAAFNRIYYGPPGTGKTHTLGELLKQDYEEPVSTVSQEEWRGQIIAERISGLTWWEGAAAALQDLGGQASVSELLSHPFILAIAAAKGRNNKNLRQTLWGTLQTHAIEESTTVKTKQRLAPAVFDKTEDSSWTFAGDFQEACADILELVDQYKKPPAPDGRIKRHTFVTFHQSFGYEEFVEGLRPVLGTEENTSDVKYEIRPGVFKDLCRRARLAPDHHFAMVIDEINRGNISKIFGELITLIETDKREGKENAMSVTLPYSGELFSVPKNVDIIGTMNTADRSLALLDTALRRRFEFEALLPDARDVPGAPLHGLRVTLGDKVIDVSKMLAAINERIEALYDRDHAIGHAYFLTLRKAADGQERMNELASVFRKRIIPLLEEYFFEDWRKIQLVLADNQKALPTRFIIQSTDHQDDLYRLFGNQHDLDSFATKHRYRAQESAFTDPDSYVGIYATLSA